MNSTQQSLKIKDIQDDIILLKDGGATLVLKVGAVNFGLLSEREQIATVASFAQMLNSLSFPIQIVIHSTKLDLSSYLVKLDLAQKSQVNALLSQMIARYKNFIQATVKEMGVLDKNFYITIPLSALELSFTKVDRLKKIHTILEPRRDQVIRQLGRVGIKASQLNKVQLVKLFFNIFNPEQASLTSAFSAFEPIKLAPPQLPTPQATTPPLPTPSPTPTPPSPPTIVAPQRAKTHPFVVEELTDNL